MRKQWQLAEGKVQGGEGQHHMMGSIFFLGKKATISGKKEWSREVRNDMSLHF